ncbi:hypothetical protein RclHR1_08800006 [Rhizophagus clarus]|uniref:Uncharacterized protein n=1 Tax=Rhizophagus clarus TaxID=94130 RepID=A0A2Z6S8F7_9GLOM|nr:hypothetical protein RclHR1_08800006 [Rhizophagus clarus]
MSRLLGSITGTIERLFGNLLPSWGGPASVPPKLPEPSEPPVPEEEPEADSEGDSDYETTDEGDTLDSESESETDSESEPEEDKILFQRIENPALKRLVENRRISDKCLCVDYLAIIPETYQYREDPLAMFENIEDQISDVYRRELARLEGIKTKIVLIVHISHFALPKIWSKPQLGIINPQNTDNRCFEACLKAYLASEEARKEGRRARNLHDVSRLRQFDNVLDFFGINFSASLHDIDIFEENNPNYAVNVLYPTPAKNDKEQLSAKLDPLRISEYNYKRKHMVDLILFTEGEEDLRDRRNNNEIPPGLNTHYCLINGEQGWNSIMRNWNKYHGRKYFCRHCMIPPFTKLDLL